jgi:hypothetical protein
MLLNLIMNFQTKAVQFRKKIPLSEPSNVIVKKYSGVIMTAKDIRQATIAALYITQTLFFTKKLYFVSE